MWIISFNLWVLHYNTGAAKKKMRFRYLAHLALGVGGALDDLNRR
jgi:hypothetical protein